MDRIPSQTDAAETRDELAAAANASAARNAPRALPVVAAFVFLVCAIYLGVQLQGRNAAERELRATTQRADGIALLIERIKAAEAAAQGGGGPSVGDPIPDLLSRLSGLAQSAGLSPGSPRERNERNEDAIERRVTYDLRQQPLDALTEWIDGAVESIPGLKVYSVQIQPGAAVRRAAGGGATPAGWDVTVTFARLERS